MNKKLRDYFIECDYQKIIKDKTLIRDVAIMHDLGLYGDDIDLDLFVFIGNEFSIGVEEIEAVLGCQIMDYFRPEFGPWWSIFKCSKIEKMESYPRFTIGMLEDAIDEILENRTIHNN